MKKHTSKWQRRERKRLKRQVQRATDKLLGRSREDKPLDFEKPEWRTYREVTADSLEQVFSTTPLLSRLRPHSAKFPGGKQIRQNFQYRRR